MAKLPLPPPIDSLRAVGGPGPWAKNLPEVLWRVRRTAGTFPLRWDAFRYFGPLPSARFDPHDPPPREQTECVASFAATWQTCFAEVFQATRVVSTRRADPYITGVRPTRPLRLLNLRDDWPIRIGASHHINTGRKDRCRAWARALRHAWPEADGLASVGIDSGLVVTLFVPARHALGDGPVFDRPLADVHIRDRVAAAAENIGYDLI